MALLSPAIAGHACISPTTSAAPITCRRNRLSFPPPSPHLEPLNSSRRSFSFTFILLTIPAFAPASLAAPPNPSSAPLPALLLELYTDRKEGFSLLRPSSWIKVDKAGATVLFEELSGRGNNIGVVVFPVRLASLADFGTPQFVADKLIQAEKRKESTKDTEVVGVSERSGSGGLQVYEFEYKVDSTRGGMKRVFSAAFVTSKKLFLLNITYSDQPERPLGGQTRNMLEQVLHSFDIATSLT